MQQPRLRRRGVLRTQDESRLAARFGIRTTSSAAQSAVPTRDSLEAHRENGVFRGTLFGAVLPGSTAVWNDTGTAAPVTLTLTITGGTREFAGASGGGSFGGFLSHLTFPPTFGGTLTLTVGAGPPGA